MQDPGFQTLLLTAALAGVTSHQVLFSRVEVDPHPLLIATSFLAAPFALSHILSLYSAVTYTLSTSFLLVATFLFSLFTSIVIYRVTFHRLNHFPGPFWAKVSKLWALTQAARTGLKWYEVDAELHEKYGDYVRTGPRELSVTDPAAIPHLLGFAAKTTKGPFYGSMEESVNTTRDMVFHKQRRKVWDSSMKSLLSSYNSQLELFTDALLVRVGQNVGKAITINELAVSYAYDVMSQLAFGQESGFLTGSASAAAYQVLDGIESGVDAVGLLSHVPWIMTLLTTFAGLGGPMKTFNDWSHKALVDRKKIGSARPDLMGLLIDATPNDTLGNSRLFSESRLIIGAGSDTTANTLSNLFILLSYHPSYVAAIRAEMDPVISAGKFNCQTAYPTLESVLMETLRLYPAVLFGSQKVTPPEGLQIGSVYVPGNCVAYMPPYLLHRDARNFVDPETFYPERWTSRAEMVLNRSAWIPFMIGTSNCPGKPLAMMELRSVIARTLHEYDVNFPEGYEFSMDFFTGITDHFTAGVPKMDLVFTKRRR